MGTCVYVEPLDQTSRALSRSRFIGLHRMTTYISRYAGRTCPQELDQASLTTLVKSLLGNGETDVAHNFTGSTKYRSSKANGPSDSMSVCNRESKAADVLQFGFQPIGLCNRPACQGRQARAL